MRIIKRNYIVRDPQKIIDSLEGKYSTVTFNPDIKGQSLFEGKIPELITNPNKTELYVNGVRYNVGIDYNITSSNAIEWINDLTLENSDILVFVYR